MAILITGATGHLGPHLVAEILRAGTFDRLYLAARDGQACAADRVRAIERIAREQLGAGEARRSPTRVIPIELRDAPAGLSLSDDDVRAVHRDVSVIVHAAADTRFGRPLDELRAANVDSTLAICRLADGCRYLRQLLLVSTTCSAGRRSGRIPERLLDDAAGFANAYEQTKWEAEQVVGGSGLPVRIARLSTCAGSHVTGYVHRFGALHHLLHWMSRGLIPMIPGTAETPVDVISTDLAAQWLTKAAVQPPRHVEVCHVALGDAAIPLGALLDFLVPLLAEGCRGVERPAIVDNTVFSSFSEMVRLSGDALMTRVQASTAAMLPALLHPKVYDTAAAELCWGGALPHPSWTTLLARVVAFGRETRRQEAPFHA